MPRRSRRLHIPGGVFRFIRRKAFKGYSGRKRLRFLLKFIDPTSMFGAFSSNMDDVEGAFVSAGDNNKFRNQVMESMYNFGINSLIPALSNRTPRGTGQLWNSTSLSVLDTSPPSGNYNEYSLFVVQDPLNIRGQVYSGYVLTGRFPGRRPPTQAILPWVMAKLGLAGESADAAAQAISIAIGRRGVRPNPYMYLALADVGADIQKLASGLAMDLAVDVLISIPPDTVQ